MQKLEKRTSTNTPTDTPQVRSNCGLPLNKEETLSVADLKTFSNNPEVDLHQQTGGLKAVVFVISIDGERLMPCSATKARKLLKAKRAHCIKMYPYTIQLDFECENQVQEISLGIDTGFGNIGFSATTSKKELISGTLILDGKTSDRLNERRMYRRGRRNKLWYRQARFLNRKKKKGWLPPSTQRRYDTHLRVINLIKSVLPISSLTLEIANFDIQKIENTDTEGVDYQQGDMYGYQNMRSYLMAREGGKCQLCKKAFEVGQPSHIHHMQERSKSGSNRAKNLAVLHKKCHTDLHKKGLKLSAPRSYKPNTYMSIIRNKFWNDLPNLKVTYGYRTFVDRNALSLPKSHNNDAFVISGGTIQERCKVTTIIQKHKNGRTLQINRKDGIRIRRQRYHIQPKDLVWINGNMFVCGGMQNKGTYLKVNKKAIPIKNIKKMYNFGTLTYLLTEAKNGANSLTSPTLKG